MNSRGLSTGSRPGGGEPGRLTVRVAVAFIGVLALWIAVPAVASARIGWRSGGIPLSESVAMKWSGTLKLTDTKTPGKQAVECKDAEEGTAGLAGAGEVSKLTTTNCTGTSACEKTETSTSITALNLPWHTELVSVGGSLHEQITSGGKGAPAFKVSCRVLLIKIEDECGGTLSANTINVEGNVTFAFIAAEKLNCTSGGSGSGVLEGSQTSTGLKAEQEEAPLWLHGGVPITGEAESMEQKGTLTLRDNNGTNTMAVQCEFRGTGDVAAEGFGAVEKMTVSKCERGAAGYCTGLYAIEVLHSPWNTELYKLSGTVYDLIGQAGKGTPEFKMRCEVGGIETIVTCEGNMDPTMTNNTERGVTAQFKGKEGLTCSRGGAGSGEIEGSLATTLSSGEILHFL